MLTIWNSNTAEQLDRLLEHIKGEGRFPFDIYFHTGGISLFCDNMKGVRVEYRALTNEKGKAAVTIQSGLRDTMQKRQETARNCEIWEAAMRGAMQKMTEESMGLLSETCASLVAKLIDREPPREKELIIPEEKFESFKNECSEAGVDFEVIDDYKTVKPGDTPGEISNYVIRMSSADYRTYREYFSIFPGGSKK